MKEKDMHGNKIPNKCKALIVTCKLCKEIEQVETLSLTACCIPRINS